MSNTILETIYWFPVKGLPGISLPHTHLADSQGIPHDRRYAITRGVEASGDWMPSRYFYINSYVDGMLDFTVEDYSPDHVRYSNRLGQSIELKFDDPRSIDKANRQLSGFIRNLPVDLDLPAPKITSRRDGGNLWDYLDTPLSIINTSSVDAIGRALDVSLDPLRFRGNLNLSGMAAWDELNLMGKRIRIGEAEIEVIRPIVRCPTPGVNPANGDRDIDFAKAMPEAFGHAYCGMYAFTAKPGRVSASDTMEIIGDASISLVDALAEAEEYERMPRKMIVKTCETGSDPTRLTLGATGPWPIPAAKPGQRLRFHLGANAWTTEYVAATSPGHYHFEIGKSETGDPVTETLRTGYQPGDELVVSGPFGRG
ncbi:MAG: MOSC domain-containing protein [Pseudomonadota bacterium]